MPIYVAPARRSIDYARANDTRLDPVLILSLHHGPHDSSAALFDDYTVLAAVAEERMNRVKGSGGFPEQSMAEVLRVAGVERRDIDVVVCSRTYFLRRYFTHWKPRERLREKLRRWAGREKLREMSVVLGKDPRRSALDVFDSAGFVADLGLRPGTRVFFSNHHFSHALPALFFTDWDDALIYTADGAGDQVSYSHNLLRDGALTNLYGDDRWLGRKQAEGSMGFAYGFVTEALGWKMSRHEGKLTGLAAFGEPTLLPQMQRHFRVTDDARIEMDFPDNEALRECFQALARTETRENAAASIQALLEGCVGEAVGRACRAPQGAPSRSRRRRLRQCPPQPPAGRDAAAGRGVHRPADGRRRPGHRRAAAVPSGARRDRALAEATAAPRRRLLGRRA